MKKYIIVLILVALNHNLKAQDTLYLACNNFYEWTHIVHSDSCYGIQIDIWSEIAQRLGLVIRCKAGDLYTCYDLLKNGEADVSIGLKDIRLFSDVINDLIIEGKIKEIITSYYPDYY